MRRVCLAILLVLCATGMARAEPDAAMLAGSCSNCHGPEARGSDSIPGIAGRPAGELLDQLRGFRSGALPSTIMGRLAKGYSEVQLGELARYFSERE